MGDKGLEILHQIIDTVWKTKTVPEKRATEVTILTYKKTYCGNYRGINTSGKKANINARKGERLLLGGVQKGLRVLYGDL